MKKIIHEVQIHYIRPLIADMKKVAKSNEAEPLFRISLDSKRIDYKEFFQVMLLSRANNVLGIAEISVGSTVGTVVNIKEIFQLALKMNASFIILCHNHPSGNLTPSMEDLNLTRNITSFGKMIDVGIIDHLILTSEGYYSFADNGFI